MTKFKVAARKARPKHQKTAPKAEKVAARKVRHEHQKTAPTVAAKVAARKARHKHQKTAPKVAAKVRNKIAAEAVRQTHRKTDASFDQSRGTQLPDTLRVLAERNLAQTREMYERSKDTLQAGLESWQKSFGAAGQGAVAINRKIIDIAERNINTGFDLATGLAGAKNLAEVMQLQAAYWRKLFGALHIPSRDKHETTKTPGSKAK